MITSVGFEAEAARRRAGSDWVKTMITLGDMAAKGMTMLEVACRRCDRQGRLSIARLIAELVSFADGKLARIAFQAVVSAGPCIRVL